MAPISSTATIKTIAVSIPRAIAAKVRMALFMIYAQPKREFGSKLNFLVPKFRLGTRGKRERGMETLGTWSTYGSGMSLNSNGIDTSEILPGVRYTSFQSLNLPRMKFLAGSSPKR